MLKIDKSLISTYLALDNKKADEYLAKVANEIFNDLKKTNDNNQTIELLDILAEFVYKVPNQTIDIVEYIINHPSDSKIIKSPLGEYEGKNHIEVVVKALEVLDRIRYIHPDGVLPLFAKLTLSDQKEINAKAQEALKHFAKYDFNVLTKSKIGYGAQRKVLDFILAWRQEEQLRHIDFVETALSEILSSSVEGTTSGLNEEAQYTITMHTGAVSPTEFLKKMRREAIDLVYKLYKTTENPKLKLKLVNILDETTRTPSNVAYGDDVVQMILDDLKYLTGIYRKMIFGGKDDKITDNLGIVEVIEKRLYWINKSEKRKIKESEKLREEILKDDSYKLFRLLVGDPLAYKEEEGWDIAEKKRTEEINALIDSIIETHLGMWFDRFNRIANQHTLIDDWQFHTFKFFIQKLSETKPQIAEKLLDMAFKESSPLKHFISSFLDGFRVGTHFAQWDKFANKIIDAKDCQFINAIIFSLNPYGDVDLKKLIREKDLALLESIVRGDGKLSFLKGIDDNVFHYALINTLGHNFRRSPERIEVLMVEEFKNNPKHLNMFFVQIPMMIHNNRWIDVKELQPGTIQFLQEKIVEIPNIDWHMQELLLAIGKRDGLGSVLDVFMKRIKKDEKRTGKKRIDERYEAIPYHFNPDLDKFIAEHSDYKEIVSGWVAKMTTDWSIYNWDVSHFLQRVGGQFGDILIHLIQKGGDDNLMKAARAMHSIDNVDFGLCMEIVRRTDNKNIIHQVEGNMYATGVVSGEYGMAEAYEKKAEKLEKYKQDESGRVKNFVSRMIKSFKESAKRERQRADEEKQLRKIEFEG